MSAYLSECKIIFLVYWLKTVSAMSSLDKSSLFSLNSNVESDVTDFILAKGYLPNDRDLPKPSIVKNDDNDATYLLSKLSDEELVKLLSDQPNKNEYNVKDIVQISTNTRYSPNYKSINNIVQNAKTKPVSNPNYIFEDLEKKRVDTVSEKRKPDNAYFRLDHKEVDPYAKTQGQETQYVAEQKINNMLYGRPSETEPENKNDEDDEKRELLFDVLVAQLKTLCCKRSKPVRSNDKSKPKIKSLLSNIMTQASSSKTFMPEIRTSQITVPKEHMFLILNDEIKSNGNDGSDLISVDPDSLGKNSSVMLLGPIATPLSDAQLKVVMSRISNELVKPEYLPLLQQIAEGTLSNEHIGLAESLISGPQTRRYIKPHRCNHQSKLARIYGGPKWLVCTGYLNLNTPSLYD